MDRILKEERNYILQMVKKIRASGANVLLIQKSILRDAVTDLSLHYLVCALSHVLPASLYAVFLRSVGSSPARCRSENLCRLLRVLLILPYRVETWSSLDRWHRTCPDAEALPENTMSLVYLELKINIKLVLTQDASLCRRRQRSWCCAT